MAPQVIEVSSRTFVVPMDCPCCGATPDSEVAVPLARSARERAAATSARSVDFPYCRHCLAHVAAWESAGVASAGVAVLGIGVGIAVAVASTPVIGVSIIVAAIALAFALSAGRRAQAKRRCREACSSPQLAVSYLGWNGQATGLAFESIAYAAKLAEQNSTTLVEDARVRKLLDRYKLARAAVPTPATAVQTLPPPPNAAEWAARLTATTGRVARRGALSRALEALSEPREREQVTRAVAAIELAGVMAGIERIGSAQAKARELRRAIDQIRGDNMPEELREILLRDLEARV